MLNYRYALSQIALLFCVLSSLQALLAGWSGLQVWLGHAAEERAVQALLLSATIGLLAGGALWLATRRAPKTLERREAMLIVSLSWLAGAILAGLPYLLWARVGPDSPAGHPFASPINCYFEAMSGLSTTGATILSEIKSVPRSILLWRGLTQWLGGLGIIVIFVAVLPTLGAGGKKLFRAEATGPDPEGVRPHIRDTARALLLIYLGMTVAHVLLLRLAGMPLYESIAHTLTSVSTGGFSTSDESIAEYRSPFIMTIFFVFMTAGGVSFALYYRLFRGQVRSFFQDTELLLYLGTLFLGAAIIGIMLIGNPIKLVNGEEIQGTVFNSMLHAFFTTSSIHTSTGYCTADFDQWPYVARAILILFMFMGGCAGSTAGGMKMIRVWIAAKIILYEIERAFRPHVVRPIKVGKLVIDDSIRNGALVYVLGFVVIFAIGTFLIVIFEQLAGTQIDLTTAGAASIATLGNVGPGLAGVGASENYLWMSGPSKMLMSLLMALGRLEVFAIAVLFIPRYWSGD